MPKPDILVILNGIIQNHINLIELNWCSYDITKKELLNENNNLISTEADLDEDFLKQNNLSMDQISLGNPESKVITSFHTFIKSQSENLVIVVSNEEIIEKVKEILFLNHLDITESFINYLNIVKEFKKYYKIEEINSSKDFSLNDILLHLSLKHSNSIRPSITELNTIARIVNKMVKDGCKFIQGEENQQKVDPITENRDISVSISVKEQKENKPTVNKKRYDKIKHELVYHIPQKYYLRIKGIPIDFNPNGLLSIINQYNVDLEDIAIPHSLYGLPIGDYIIRLHDDYDYKELKLFMNFYQLSIRKGEVIFTTEESTEKEFQSAIKSLKFKDSDTKLILDKHILRIKHLPLLVSEESIRVFFKEYDIVEKGIRFLISKEGVLQGEAAVAFLEHRQAEDALKQKKGDLLGNQVIEISRGSIALFEEYSSSGAFSALFKNIYKHTTPDKVTRSLMVSNLPLDSSINDILELVQHFNLSTWNISYDYFLISTYGCTLIQFNNEDDAKYAKTYLQSKHFNVKNRRKKLKADYLLDVVNRGSSID